MRSYAAQIGTEVCWGSLRAVYRWAADESLARSTPVRILTARAGERHALVIAESINGRIIPTGSGRTVPVAALRRLL